jgi:hypothetical protein
MNILQNKPQKIQKVNNLVNELDLDIDNYTLEEILELFDIPADFCEQDLRKAKNKVLKSHPDKSGLDSSYFIFYSKAYKTLFSIWEFKNRTKSARSTILNNIEYYPEMDDSHKKEFTFTNDKKKVLHDFMSKKKYTNDPQKFNKWFNENFEKVMLRDESEEKGYGDWLQSDEGLDMEGLNDPVKAKENFFAKKKKAREESGVILRTDEPSGLNLGSGFVAGSGIGNNVPETYECGDIFSKLPYEDLRRAHTETVIPVTEEDDFHNVRKFQNVNEYSQHRSEEEKTMVPLSEKQAKEYFSNKERLYETESTQRAYHITKQMEEMGKRQNTFWSGLQRLTG